MQIPSVGYLASKDGCRGMMRRVLTVLLLYKNRVIPEIIARKSNLTRGLTALFCTKLHGSIDDSGMHPTEHGSSMKGRVLRLGA
jgi:hypothetical protein